MEHYKDGILNCDGCVHYCPSAQTCENPQGPFGYDCPANEEE